MRDLPSIAELGFDRIAAFSPDLRRLIGPGRPLGGNACVYRPSLREASGIQAVVGPARCVPDDGARAYAERTGLALFSVDLELAPSSWRGRRFRPLSLVVEDSTGTARSASASSVVRWLEDEAQADALGPELLERARRLREFIVTNGLCRFADAHSNEGLSSEANEPKPVIVVVQSGHGSATSARTLRSLDAMLERAEREHPDSPLWLLPESDSGLEAPDAAIVSLRAHPRARWLSIDVDRSVALERAAHVYVLDSPFGFDALLRAVPVTVFGEPCYAGWGLTHDVVPVERSRRCTLDELVAVTLLLAPRYFDWVLGCETTAEDAFEHLALQRRRFLENQGRFVCVGLSLWKHLVISRYLESRGNELVFLRNPAALSRLLPKPDTKIVVWASRPHEQAEHYASTKHLPLWQMEDGFMRSVGLGSDWSAPGSLVFDELGIYYDPRQPSRLEDLLNSARFTEHELEQAEELRLLIMKLRVSKYNTTQDRDYRPRSRPGQQTLLVPGQVADDASVRFGGGKVDSVESLLLTVREMAPEAHIVYKPHPDVLSGNRRGHVDAGLGVLFDELVLDVPIARCLEQVDAVHTISSLVGFEALLRKLPVTCHGQPFYSGWGLTRDLQPLERRSRRLSLQELIAGALMRYPRYYHFPSGAFCTASQMVTVLSRQTVGTQTGRYPRPIRKLRSLLTLAKDLLNAG